MTEFRETIGFKNLSAIDFQTKSCTGQGDIRFGNWSLIGGFTQATANGVGNYRFNPNTANLSDIRNTLAQMIVELYSPNKV